MLFSQGFILTFNLPEGPHPCPPNQTWNERFRSVGTLVFTSRTWPNLVAPLAWPLPGAPEL